MKFYLIMINVQLAAIAVAVSLVGQRLDPAWQWNRQAEIQKQVREGIQ